MNGYTLNEDILIPKIICCKTISKSRKRCVYIYRAEFNMAHVWLLSIDENIRTWYSLKVLS